MILILVSIIAVFLAGAVSGIFAMIVIGIRAEERRITRTGAPRSVTGAASRCLLSTQKGTDLPSRVASRR